MRIIDIVIWGIIVRDFLEVGFDGFWELVFRDIC
jgi:hypothetical protein